MLQIVLWRTLIVIIGLWLVCNVHAKSKDIELGKNHTRLPLPKYHGEEDFLINTTSCFIPNYQKTMYFIERRGEAKDTCGQRIVYVRKLPNNEIKFEIDYNGTKAWHYNCCYSFISRSSDVGYEDYKLSYSKCMHFEHGDKTELKEEVITVSCEIKLITNSTKDYYDKYLILKKKTVHQDVNNSSKTPASWNVLILGMDAMSRARAYYSLPKAIQYLLKHKWLDYRGYHKVAQNTFPNVMAMLTGIHSSKLYEECSPGMENCRDLLIWNRFKEAGYMTAYGEDSAQPIYYDYPGYSAPPTDHFARPMFLEGEYKQGHTICINSRPSNLRLLNYASQFVESYKDSKFFGFFFISYSSHDPDHLPHLAEGVILDFLKILKKNRVLRNTFVIFLSDHGINYGENRYFKEAYYDSRLPMFFMWVPTKFRKVYPNKYYNLQLNQNRLATHWDLHATMLNILKLSHSRVHVVPPDACPNCHSLTEELSPRRTCEDVNIIERWCACHSMTEVTYHNDTQRSVDAAIIDIRNLAFSVETTNCFKCYPFTLKKVLRNHMYKRGDKTYFIIAFEVHPEGIIFEAKVENIASKFRALHPTEHITPFFYNHDCAKTRAAYCVCLKIANCV